MIRPLFEYQYYLHNYGQTGGTSGIDIDVRKAWQITMGVEDVVVAILDDGFTRYHEDIDMSRILWNWGYDYIGETYKVIIPDNDPSPGSIESHGIACQGIILATTNNLIGIAGIAPNCSLLPIKCFDDNGHGTGWSSVYEQSISCL